MFIAARYAVLSLNQTYVWAGRNMGAGRATLFMRVILPASLPQLFTGLRVGLAHSFVVLFAAELIGARSGLGYLILDAENAVRFDRMMVGIVTFGILGFLQRPCADGGATLGAARADHRDYRAGRGMRRALDHRRQMVLRTVASPRMGSFGALRTGDVTVVARPRRGLDRIFDDIVDGALLHHAGVTLARSLAGFSAAVVVGAALATAMSLSGLFGRMFEPIFFLGYPVPKIAMFPVFAFVFGVGSSSKIAFTFLECLYPIVISAYLGIRGVQTRMLWTAQNMGANSFTVFRRVVVPAALPAIFSGLRIALPLSLTVVVVTEMIGDTEGLGAYITICSTRFRYANVYAGILTIGICGMFLDQLVVQSRRWLIPWQEDRAVVGL